MNSEMRVYYPYARIETTSGHFVDFENKRFTDPSFCQNENGVSRVHVVITECATLE